MSVSFGTNTNVVKKRVKFVNTNSSAAVTLYAGMPLCYQFDTTTNVLGWDKENSEEGTTTAEGYQNEGKFMIVDLPDDDNIHAFAGVAVANSWTGSSTVADDESKWLDVYIPNGAIVPVRAGVECTVGRTVLAVITATQYLGHPLSATQAKPVAIAWETNATLDTTAGIVLAKLDPDMFLNQNSTGDTILVGVGGTAASASMVLNSVESEFGHTGGYGTALMVKNTQSGALAATGGSCAVLGYINVSGSITAVTGYTRSILGQLNLSGTINGSNQHLCGVMAQLSGSPTFTECARVATIMCDISLGVAPTAGDLSHIRIASPCWPTVKPDHVFDVDAGSKNLFNLANCANVAEDTTHMVFAGGTGSGALSTGGTWKKVRVVIDDSEYFFVALPDPTSA